MQDSVMLFPLTKEEFQTAIREAVKEVLSESERTAKQKELLDAKELISWLGISLSTLNKWKAEDKIPYKRLGKRVFFSREDVKKALDDSGYFKLKEIENL